MHIKFIGYTFTLVMRTQLNNKKMKIVTKNILNEIISNVPNIEVDANTMDVVLGLDYSLEVDFKLDADNETQVAGLRVYDGEGMEMKIQPYHKEVLETIVGLRIL